MIERKEYLEKLKKWKDKDLIKVITGIRRCGKSTLFELYIDYLKSIGIEDNHIISVNLENPDNEFDTYKELYKYVKEQIKDKKQYYVFLDEVQKVSDDLNVPLNLMNPGINEAARAILRRNLEKLLVVDKNDKDVQYICKLAKLKNVDIEEYPLEHYKAISIAKN